MKTQGRYSDNLMFDTGVLDNEEVFVGQDMVEKEIPVTIAGDVVTTASVEIPDKLALAQTLIEIESVKPKAVTTVSLQLLIKYKGKGIMVEKPKKMQMKDQVLFDKQELNLMRKTGLQEKRKKSMLP
ncbi:hypothetical protein Tco_0926219 [Tanacetum coccineum]|uniref:Uncharacterized protein n=1 Tax=Tanacetum coccineum TaxID=301880 RepID=A0ABQ5DAA8_9ASTR